MRAYSPESGREARDLRNAYLADHPAHDNETIFEFRARIRAYIKEHASPQLLEEMERNERYVAEAKKEGTLAR